MLQRFTLIDWLEIFNGIYRQVRMFQTESQNDVTSKATNGSLRYIFYNFNIGERALAELALSWFPMALLCFIAVAGCDG